MSRIEAIGLDGAAWEVRVCELKTAPQGKYPLALKIMKKVEVIRLKQVTSAVTLETVEDHLVPPRYENRGFLGFFLKFLATPVLLIRKDLRFSEILYPYKIKFQKL